MSISSTALSRRSVLRTAAAVSACASGLFPLSAAQPDALRAEWLEKWAKYIRGAAGRRYCDRETGEEIGWLISPFLNGFYYGYLATRDEQWIDMLMDWAGAWIGRGIKEPDGHVGWPKAGGASTSAVPELVTDNMLGEAMGFRPVVLAADIVLKTPALKAKYGDKAKQFLELSEQTFVKWDSRGCWRNVKEGGVWVVPHFGIDQKTGGWTEGYAKRNEEGFTHPANKQNHIAQWLLAMHDVTGKAMYRQRAEAWFRQMRSRMRLRENGRYFVWNYWDPSGPWDYKPDGSPRHWVGVHPNGGYYAIDVEGIVAAHEHGLVFTRADIDLLIATNRDFMWDGNVQGARFRRIDGGPPDKRWQNTPGVLWTALAPYDATLRRVFEANHNPASWAGISSTPRYLVAMAPK